ncbi:MAG: hypothetical protein CVU13_11530 [Bacteroidetes bacterium HGW-Bacteroidetes-8]|nr:MAG: hypothetical protein CVU13_11530 [Bacteroidetes bacterium HGW-Bacteroidetes-8]
MRKKSETTIIERALEFVPRFDRVFQKLQQQVIIRGQNKRAISLPSLKKDAKLPVILNRPELKRTL